MQIYHLNVLKCIILYDTFPRNLLITMKLPRHQIRRAAIIPDEQTLNELQQFIKMATTDNHLLLGPLRVVNPPANKNQADKRKEDGSSYIKEKSDEKTLS